MCFWLHAHTYMHVECMIVTKQCYILGILQTCICNIKFIIKCIRVWKSNGLYSDYGKNSQDHFSFKGRDKKCHSQPEIQKNWKYYHDNTKLVARFSISIKPARKSTYFLRHWISNANVVNVSLWAWTFTLRLNRRTRLLAVFYLIKKIHVNLIYKVTDMYVYLDVM